MRSPEYFTQKREELRVLRSSRESALENADRHEKLERTHGPEMVWDVIHSGIDRGGGRNATISGYFADVPREVDGKRVPNFFGLMDPSVILSEIEGDRKQGTRQVVLDVFGTGVIGVECGASDPTGWTLSQPHDEKFSPEVDMHIGNMWDRKNVLSKHLRALDRKKEGGAEFRYAFMRPMGGLHSTSGNIYTTFYMYDRIIRGVLSRLDRGGTFFVELSNLGRGADMVRAMGYLPGYSVRVSSYRDDVCSITKNNDYTHEEDMPSLRTLLKMAQIDS
jgi:hypothetical protein